MNISANLSLLFAEYPLAERVLAARVAGFAGVEIQFPYELPAVLLKERLEHAGVPLVLMNLPAGDLMAGGLGLACIPDRQLEFDAALAEALSYAAMVRPLAVNVLAGRQPDSLPREEALGTLVNNLRKTAAEFAILGIPVLCEAINPLDMPGFLINTPDDLKKLLQQVNHPNFKVQLDFYHMARQGINIPCAIQQLAGKIGHVQFADCPGRGAPGTGELDFAVMLNALWASGYQGWLGAEYRPAEQGTQASLGWLSLWADLAERKL